MNNSHSDEVGLLVLILVLLVAAVVSVPLARWLRLSAIVAYIGAGIAIGPHGLGVFSNPQTVLFFAELGVVLLLFVIGLELEFSRLLEMRRDIFGFGAAQLVLTALVIGSLAFLLGLLEWRGAIVAGLALAMSATSIALRLLEERGDLQQVYGQRAFAVLLFQDMSIVPLLALLPLLAPFAGAQTSLSDALWAVAKIGGAIGTVVLAGRYLLNPGFRLLANTGAREVMTAAALLLVLGTALLMQAAGMSMALGAFLAGVLLAESSYRHELEADIEPFRGLLLALFFMGVGMVIDMNAVWTNLLLIVIAALIITALKLAIVWVLFRGTCARDAEALRAGSVLTAAGEFAFVLIPLGISVAVLSREQGSVLSAIAAVTMLLGPPTAMITDLALRRVSRRPSKDADDFGDARGSVLVIGFGRFGQIVSQILLAEGIDITTIDNNAERIRNAAEFGFKIYYGDGTRLDVLRAAGAAPARLIAVCVDGRESATKIVDLVKTQFPGTKIYARSYDRPHTLELIGQGVDYEIRETFESAMMLGRRALEGLGLSPDRAREVEEDVRKRDLERLALQQAGGLMAGVDVLHRPAVRPVPLTRPEHAAKPLNPEAEDILGHETEFSS